MERWFRGVSAMTRSINLSFLLLLALGGLPSAATAQTADRPRAAGPTGNVASWFKDSDYPSSAKRAGQQGRVATLVSIDEQGRVAGCRITQSSGSAALDEKTCDLVRQRATFGIQRDATGKAVPYTYTIATRWVLRGYFPPVIEMPWRSAATYQIDQSGTVMSCAVSSVGATSPAYDVSCPVNGTLARNIALNLRGGANEPGVVEVSLEKALEIDGAAPLELAYTAPGRTVINLTVLRFDADAKGKLANCRIVKQVGGAPKDFCKEILALFAPRPAPPRGVTVTIALSRGAGK
jgi:TonB family protein